MEDMTKNSAIARGCVIRGCATPGVWPVFVRPLVVFVVDITKYILELNVKLQGLNQLLNSLFSKVKSFELKAVENANRTE